MGEHAVTCLALTPESDVFSHHEVEHLKASSGVEIEFESTGVVYEAGGHQLWIKLAGPLDTLGRRADSRHALSEALALVDPSDTVHLALIHTWLGANYSQDRRFDDAMPHFEAAKNLLPDKPIDADDAFVEQWVVLMNRWSENYRNQSLYADELTVLEEIQPVVDARGTVRQRSQNLFLMAKAQAELAHYRVSDEVIADMRRATEMVPHRGQELGDGWEPMLLGYLAFLGGHLELSREQLERALAMAEKTGEAQLRAACMVIRPLTALRAHDTQGVRELAPVAVAACEGIGFPEWVAMAKGSLAWLAYQEGRHDDVLALAAECDELMKAPHGPEIFVNWVRLWPVVAVHLAAGLVEPAVVAAHQMLDPSQQRFENELESLVISARQAWDDGDALAAEKALKNALVLAQELRYL
jgi:tetratricopeptide (TPR) repeat protein